MKKYRTVIIGAGNIGAFYSPPDTYKGIITHAHAYAQEKRTNLVAFMDIDPQRAKKAAFIWHTNAYTNLEQMLEKERPDIVSICTPEEVHEKNLLQCFRFKPKLVFCEKPFTTEVQAGNRIVKAYAREKIPLAVNYTRRFNQAIVNLKKDINQNKFGAYFNLVGIYNKGILHNGSHLVDLLRFFFGDITQLTPLSARIDWKKTDPTLDSFLKFSSGLTAHLVGTDVRDYEIFELDMLFKNARVKLLQSGTLIEYTPIVNSKLLRGEKVIGKPIVTETKLTPTLLKIPAMLIETIEKGVKLPCSAEEALMTQKACQELIELWKN